MRKLISAFACLCSLALSTSWADAIDHLEALDLLRASFTQRTVAADGFVQEGSGELLVARDQDASLWEYRQPEHQTYLLVGERLWLYAHLENQLTVTDLDQTGLLNLARMDRQWLQEHYRVETTDNRVLLHDEHSGMRVDIELQSGLPHRLHIETPTGDSTRIQLDQVRIDTLDTHRLIPVIPDEWEVVHQ